MNLAYVLMCFESDQDDEVRGKFFELAHLLRAKIKEPEKRLKILKALLDVRTAVVHG